MFLHWFKRKKNDENIPEKRVIAFSLWGNHPKYLHGALRNLELQKEHYPDWICRYFVAESLSSTILDELKSGGAEIIQKPASQGYLGLFWRFEAGCDPEVSRFIVRDCDSRLNAREALAVQAWIHSGKPFHLMRDHVYHDIPILGAMWGAVRGFIPDFEARFHRWIAQVRPGDHHRGDYFYTDQEFLNKEIWPLIRKRHLAHDDLRRVTKKENLFPVLLPNGQFVGQQFDENDKPILI
jgi:hypothetical protein